MLLEELLGLLEADDGYAPSTRTANDIAYQKGKLGHSLSGNPKHQRSTYRGDDQDDYSDSSWSRQAPPRTSPLTKTELMTASDKVTELTAALKRTFGPKLLEVVKSFEHNKTVYLECRIYIDYAKTEYLEFYFKCENSRSTFARYEKVIFRTKRDNLFSNLDVYEWNEYGKWCGDDASETMSKLSHRITDIRKLVHDWENKKITKKEYWAGWDEMRRRFR
jgi:hypothetical protein